MLFRKRPRPTPAEQDAAERERRDAVAAVARREREEAKFAEEQRRESAERIASACRMFGHWFPGSTVVDEPPSRLSGRLSWRERAIENIRESWRAMTTRQ